MSNRAAYLDEAGYYSALGVAPNAPAATIRKAYMQLARSLHPDKNPSKEATLQLQAISEAWSVLKDKEKRRVYDRDGKEGLEALEDDELDSDSDEEDDSDVMAAFLTSLRAGAAASAPSATTDASATANAAKQRFSTDGTRPKAAPTTSGATEKLRELEEATSEAEQLARALKCERARGRAELALLGDAARHELDECLAAANARHVEALAAQVRQAEEQMVRQRADWLKGAALEAERAVGEKQRALEGEVARGTIERTILRLDVQREGDERVAIAMAKHSLARAEAVRRAEERGAAEIAEMAGRTEAMIEAAARAAAQKATVQTIRDAAEAGGLSSAAVKAAAGPMVDAARAEGEAKAEARAIARQSKAVAAAREEGVAAMAALRAEADAEASRLKLQAEATVRAAEERVRDAEERAAAALAGANELRETVSSSAHAIRSLCEQLRGFRRDEARRATAEAEAISRRVTAAMRSTELRLLSHSQGADGVACTSGGGASRAASTAVASPGDVGAAEVERLLAEMEADERVANAKATAAAAAAAAEAAVAVAAAEAEARLSAAVVEAEERGRLAGVAEAEATKAAAVRAAVSAALTGAAERSDAVIASLMQTMAEQLQAQAPDAVQQLVEVCARSRACATRMHCTCRRMHAFPDHESRIRVMATPRHVLAR